MILSARRLLALFPGWCGCAAWLFALCVPALAEGEARPGPGGADFQKEIRPLLETYCFKCHGEEKQKGDLRLDTYHDLSSIVRDRKHWLLVLEQLETDEMPPKKPFLKPGEREKLIAWVDATVNDIDWTKHRNAGHVTIPRLTRLEYRNTIRDLLGIEIDASINLSEDGQGHSGFNNDRDALFVTPSLMEKYFEAAESALNALMAHRRDDNATEQFFEAEDMFMTESGSKTSNLDGTSEGYYLNRGQMTLYDSAQFPVDGFYEFIVRAKSSAGETGARLRISDVPAGDIIVPAGDDLAEYRLTTFVRAGARQMAWNIQKPPVRLADASMIQLKAPDEYPPLPENASELISRGAQESSPAWPDPEAGASQEIRQAILRVNRESQSVQRAYEWLRLHGPEGDPREIERFRRYVRERSVPLEEAFDELAAALGVSRKEVDRRFAGANTDKIKANRDLEASLAHINDQTLIKPPGFVGLDWIRIRGPVEPARSTAEEQVLIAEPGNGVSEEQAVRAILDRFVMRAFRRPASGAEIARYADLFAGLRREGEPYDDALKLTLQGVLISPNFLFRNELVAGETTKPANTADGGGDDVPLDDYQIASRLSYFLWMSMPDDELFALAKQGRLRDPDTVTRQIDRMLADPRADGFSKLFTGQWLGFGPEGQNIFPDDRKFRKVFTPELRDAMVQETALFFDYLIDEDRSLLELIDSRQTYVNADLAALYGLEDVTGAGMQLVALDDRRRGGVLGMASVLSSTSTPLRTSPVLRGTWMLEKLLAYQVPEPPENAGELPDNAGEIKGRMTLRDELEQHRQREECASCHEKIDPLGFGLENFDAIGQWRDTTPSGPVDATGTLPDGSTFTGVVELKDYLLKERKGDFIRGVTENMLAFALGRELQGYDEPAVETILKALNKDGYQASTLVKQVVLSYPFTHQNNTPNPH